MVYEKIGYFIDFLTIFNNNAPYNQITTRFNCKFIKNINFPIMNIKQNKNRRLNMYGSKIRFFTLHFLPFKRIQELKKRLRSIKNLLVTNT